MSQPLTQRVALACCGLGHVRRGNETWAHNVADVLHQAGEPITLFTGGPLEAAAPVRPLWNLPRDTPWLSRVSWHRRYMLEQKTFYWSLARQLRRGEHDIAHVADPQVAWWLNQRSTKSGISVIYKDGLLLGPQWMSNFKWNQVLAPFYKEEGARLGFSADRWFVIPHLVDTERFGPVVDKAPHQQRILGKQLPSDALVVLAVGALGAKNNKRLDYVAREIASLGLSQVHLIVAGQAAEADRVAFEDEFRPALGERLHLLTNVSPAEMPWLYRCADVFAHGALREPFGIVFIEAMSSGLPVIAHDFAVTRWIVGDGGIAQDLRESGSLAAILRQWSQSPGDRRTLGQKARARAVATFASARIAPLYREMYREIRNRREEGR
ncbi:MAG TPA: glycosyltransferase family 4 protein [Candidatus Limnocylindria bacterium]|jgi:glycosyltransferase involved in cell wall biosynthesis|nr:glycosyltransferase family 4 protein [Candidatus Limnocylindria bacterium]